MANMSEHDAISCLNLRKKRKISIIPKGGGMQRKVSCCRGSQSAGRGTLVNCHVSLPVSFTSVFRTAELLNPSDFEVFNQSREFTD